MLTLSMMADASNTQPSKSYETIGMLILEELRCIRSDMQKEIRQLGEAITKNLAGLKQGKPAVSSELKPGASLTSLIENIDTASYVNDSNKEHLATPCDIPGIAEVCHEIEATDSFTFETTMQGNGNSDILSVWSKGNSLPQTSDLHSYIFMSENDFNEELQKIESKSDKKPNQNLCNIPCNTNNVFPVAVCTSTLSSDLQGINPGGSICAKISSKDAQQWLPQKIMGKSVEAILSDSLSDTTYSKLDISDSCGSLATTNDTPVHVTSESGTDVSSLSTLSPLTKETESITDLALSLDEDKSGSEEKALGPHQVIESSPSKGNGRVYHCEYCGEIFKRSSVFNQHLRRHTGEKPYQCDTCGKRFAHLSTLSSHVKLHSGEKPYVCSVCGKSFKTHVSLRSHSKTHIEEKEYKCQECGKSFRYREGWRLHMRMHTGEKPYHCKVCGKNFARFNTYSRHVTSIHSGEKPHECSHCDKSFNTVAGLNVHLKIHTGEKSYHCSECGKSFIQKVTLKQHMMVHTGEKPYQCKVCGNLFRRLQSLKKHESKH